MEKRVKILDVLRVVSIFMVMLYHYYQAYPDIEKNFEFGALGVPLFFIISGFVIYSSLQNTKDYKTFLIKRFIRLSPAMLICSTITFVFFRFLYTGEDNYDNSKNIINYIIANTFIDPNFINIFIGYVKYYYIDMVYWSLWVEICFYTLMGWLFFKCNKNHIILYYIIVSVVGAVVFSSKLIEFIKIQYNVSEVYIDYYYLVKRGFIFFSNSFWFLIGIFLYFLYNDKKNYKYIIYIIICFGINIFLDRFNTTLIIFSILTFIFLMIFIYYPDKMDFICRPLLCKIGIASYSMYLIHYYIGMVMVKYLNKNIFQSYMWPFIVIVFFITFGLFSYQYLEKPLGKIYKKILGQN